VIDEAVLQGLADGADLADADADWPASSWALLRQGGALAWSVPTEYGGQELAGAALLAGYERLAGACLTTAFLLSQRDAAVRRLIEHAGPEVRRRLLPPLARGATFTTVGLSQLTTSRQHQSPALIAAPQTAGYLLDGFIPWVSGAGRADFLVMGAALPDGRQILAALPRDRAGVEVEPPLDLCAVRGSQTGQVRCRGVRLEADEVFAGPAERVLAGKGGGGLETSCLALGLAGAAVDFLHREAAARPELREAAESFERLRGGVRRRLHELADGPVDAAEAAALRVQANRLALAATQAALTAAKGTGFARPHPAQRWARQALFFLVWSCPRPAAEGMMSHLVAAASEDDKVTR
jgi:alkylation response protein AidB-like acyl-CoA dehydrogenase